MGEKACSLSSVFPSPDPGLLKNRIKKFKEKSAYTDIQALAA
jgi:hypothetical protein